MRVLPRIVASFFVLGAPPALAAESFGDSVYYLGDLHAHTGYSGDASSAEEGCSDCGWMADMFQTAKDNGLDFVAFTDHVNGDTTNPKYASESDYAALTASVLAADEPGTFVTIPAAEVFFASSSKKYGHKSLLMFGSNEELETLAESELWPSGTVGYRSLTGCDQVGDWMDTLTATRGDAVILPHHTTAVVPMATDWTCHYPEWEVAVEGYSVHGSGWRYADPYDTNIHVERSTGSVEAALDTYGLRLGFVAATDRHDTLPGEVCIGDQYTGGEYAGGLTIAAIPAGDSFTRSAVGEAIRDRRTIASSGPMVPVEIVWSYRDVVLGGLGDEIDVPAEEDLGVEVRVPTDHADVVNVVSIRSTGWTGTELTDQGDGVWTGTVAAADVPSYLFVDVEIDGEAYWGTGACSDGGDDDVEHLWASPTWITLVDPVDDDVDDDGYEAPADCDDGDAKVHPGAEETWYDGIDSDCLGDDDYDRDGDSWQYDVDCDDVDASVNPGADEVWYDGADQDCDGNDDDQDGDTFILADDCDDTDPSVWPGATETPYDGIDADCAGDTDYDADGDSQEATEYGGVDCDDADASVWLGAPEVWYDGIDEDCGGDDDYDQDGDGFRSDDHGGSDCDDTLRRISPLAAEVWYNGTDENCDGNDTDRDRDGWPYTTDCNDLAPRVYPGAPGWNEDCTRR